MADRSPRDRPYTGETVPMHTPPQSALPPRPSPGRPQRPEVRPPTLPTPQRRGSVRRWLKRALWLLLIGAIVALVGTIVLQQRVARKVALADIRDNRPPANALIVPMNILLLGVDVRQDNPEEGIRSDTLMLLHLDPAGGWASMLSIPRDSLANIPNFGDNKINAAFARGYENAAALYGADADPTAAGAALAADTVEQFLGLREQGQRINYVATINFNGFAAIVDAIGGIEVDVPFEIVDTEYPTEDFGTTTIRILAGPQTMDGTTALQYVRTRHVDSDFGRAQRQQQVLQAIVAKLRDQPLLLRPFTALRLVDAAGSATRTTLPVGRLDALLLATLLARVDPGRITQYRITPEEVGLQEFGSDLLWSAADIQALVRKTLTPPGETTELATVQVQNGAGVAGIAGQVADTLRAQNFTVATPENAAATATSQIIDYGDHPATRARLSAVLGDMPVIEGSSVDAPAGVDIVVVLGEDYTQYWNE